MYVCYDSEYIPLLPARTCTSTTELLGFHPPGISNQECPVVCDKLLLQLDGGESIDVFSVVCNDGLRNGLTDSINLRGVSSSLHAYANVNSAVRVLPGDKNSLIDLEAKDFGLEERQRRAVDVNETSSLLCVGDRGGGLAR